MSEIKLSETQATFLRDQPLGKARNKVGAALGLVQATQKELAAVTGITEADLSEIRNGKYKRLYLERAQRIAGAFGVCTDDIFPRLVVRRRAAKPRRKAEVAA